MSMLKEQKQATQKVFAGKQDEKILVVAREHLFPNKTPHGLVPVDPAWYQKIIAQHGEYLWRSQAESDPSYKQVIPYLVFQNQDKYFLMQRKATSSEQRLKNKYTFGIGGHIRKEDVQGSDIVSWAAREFDEEVVYQGSKEISFLGLLNQEADSVGQVHTGFVFLLKGNSDQISVRSELASGRLVTLQEALQVRDMMEGWSQFVFDFLMGQGQEACAK